MIIKSKLSLALIIVIICPFLYSTEAYAPYSDWAWNKRQAQRSSNMTLKYGGPYGQAATNYMNSRYGYLAGTMSPAQRRQFNRAMRQSDAVIRSILNNPIIWR
jgi:hypothetical protein